MHRKPYRLTKRKADVVPAKPLKYIKGLGNPLQSIVAPRSEHTWVGRTEIRFVFTGEIDQVDPARNVYERKAGIFTE